MERRGRRKERKRVRVDVSLVNDTRAWIARVARICIADDRLCIREGAARGSLVGHIHSRRPRMIREWSQHRDSGVYLSEQTNPPSHPLCPCDVLPFSVFSARRWDASLSRRQWMRKHEKRRKRTRPARASASRSEADSALDSGRIHSASRRLGSRWKGAPLSEYIPIKKPELRYTRSCRPSPSPLSLSLSRFSVVRTPAVSPPPFSSFPLRPRGRRPLLLLGFCLSSKEETEKRR